MSDPIGRAVAEAIRGIHTYGKDQAIAHDDGGGAQVGQGNIGGGRNRGAPGYPVPPEMRSSTSSGGPLEAEVAEAILRLAEAGQAPTPAEVFATDEFSEWYRVERDVNVIREVDKIVSRLEQFGVNLREPYSKKLPSKYAMFELRSPNQRYPIRIPYCFNPDRRAVLLMGFNKKGEDMGRQFTVEMVKICEPLWEQYLREHGQGLHREWREIREGGPIDRMTGPTDLSGVPIKPDDPDETLEGLISGEIGRLLEAGVGDPNPHADSIGATIGTFQPFHAGHASTVRDMANRFTRTIVIVDSGGPLSYSLRHEMMRASLPDVWDKIEVYPMAGMGSAARGVADALASIAASGHSSLRPSSAVNLLVGRDRFPEAKAAAEEANRGGRFRGVISVTKLPRTTDEVSGGVSAERALAAAADADRETARSLFDPHLSADPAAFEQVLSRIRRELGKREGLLRELGMGASETGIGFTRGGSWGSSGWSRAWLADDEDGDSLYNVMNRSPNRMLPFKKGNEEHPMPGQESIDAQNYEDEDTEDIGDPTDLGR